MVIKTTERFPILLSGSKQVEHHEQQQVVESAFPVALYC